MKLDMKKFKLAAAAFVCGFVFCALLVSLTQQSSPPVAAGPTLASSQVAAPVIWRLPPDTSPLEIHLRSESLPPQSERLDLIDTRAPHVDIHDIQ
jgi:hypothetical protein